MSCQHTFVLYKGSYGTHNPIVSTLTTFHPFPWVHNFHYRWKSAAPSTLRRWQSQHSRSVVSICLQIRWTSIKGLHEVTAKFPIEEELGPCWDNGVENGQRAIIPVGVQNRFKTWNEMRPPTHVTVACTREQPRQPNSSNRRPHPAPFIVILNCSTPLLPSQAISLLSPHHNSSSPPFPWPSSLVRPNP